MGAVTEEAVWAGLGPDALLQHWNHVLQDPEGSRTASSLGISVETVIERVRGLLL